MYLIYDLHTCSNPNCKLSRINVKQKDLNLNLNLTFPSLQCCWHFYLKRCTCIRLDWAWLPIGCRINLLKELHLHWWDTHSLYFPLHCTWSICWVKCEAQNILSWKPKKCRLLWRRIMFLQNKQPRTIVRRFFDLLSSLNLLSYFDNKPHWF